MENKVAVITGGAGHIGRSIALELAESGVKLAILDKQAEKGQAFASQLNRDFGGQHHFINADLLEKNCFHQIAEQIETHFGRADYIVNNAAFYDDVPGWGVPFEEEGYDAWMNVMQVNLLAPFFLTQALYPFLKESGVGSVVNIGSIYNVVGPDHGLYEGTDMTNPAAYAASKGGLLQTTRWLSTVLAPEVRVNMVSPGGIARGQNEKFVERYCERTPLKRMGREADVAGMTVFLLSDKAGYITGQNMIVDGGWTVL